MVNNSAKVEEVQREVAGLKAQLSDWCPKMKRELTNLKQNLAKLKGEMRAMNLKAESPAPTATDVAVPAPPPPAREAGVRIIAIAIGTSQASPKTRDSESVTPALPVETSKAVPSLGIS
jgi:predicted exporter